MDEDQSDDAEADGEQLTRSATDDAGTDASADDEGAAASTDEATDASTDDGVADASTDGADTPAVDDALPDAAWLEESAESFVELEAELDVDDAPPDRARVVGAETVPASEVPADYPRSIDTDQVLALGLAVAGTEEVATAYFAWPPADESAPLSRLLAALGIEPDSFADLNGRRLLVSVEDGHVLPIVPPTRPAGSEHGLHGVLGGAAALLGLLGAAVLDLVSLPAVLLGLLVLSLFVLPIATYLDARHVRSTADWDQGPLFWAILQAFPVVNLLVTAAYLFVRRGARPLDRS